MKTTENPYASDGSLPAAYPVTLRGAWDEGYRTALRDVASAFITMPGEPIFTPLDVTGFMLHTLTTINPRHKWTVEP
jgi:hypothetical protein